MYKIGEFSLLNKVTIKTLRYYNEIGLFIPKVIDKYTGYRYYDEDQLEEFNKISKYKEWTCKINVDTKKRSTFFCYNKIGGRIWQELEKNQIDIGQKKIRKK